MKQQQGDGLSPVQMAEKMINNEALWAYRYMKQLNAVVDDYFPSAKIVAFKQLCLDEGDYKVKTENEGIGNKKGLGR